MDQKAQILQTICQLVNKMAGIQLGPKQQSMVESRLRTRMLKLNINDFDAYAKYLRDNEISESQALLSLMTTHHTYFFREFAHFEFLINQGLDKLIQEARTRGDKKIRIWSAACSKGHEVYSLAMFFRFHLKDNAPDIDFEIHGSDVDPESVKSAMNGVFRHSELKQCPANYLTDNWIKGEGEVKDFSKAKKDLRSKLNFSTQNLLSLNLPDKQKKFDVIFCRNVFIYFNNEQIKTITKSLLSNLTENGFLFLGVSESLNGLGLPISPLGPSIYGQKSAKVSTQTTVATPQTQTAKPQLPKILNVLCVDDSGTILALMKKILTEEHGFRVTATAANGRIALELIKSQKFDLITLDLHMPELDGLGFLQESKNLNRPPTMVVSSVSRDDKSMGQKALLYGAEDYVEKPSLENLAQASDQIRSKLKLIAQKNLAKIVASNPTPIPTNVPQSASSPTPKAQSPSTVNFKKTDVQKKPITAVKPIAKIETNTHKPLTNNSLTSTKKIKVLIVDDSSTIRQLLGKILSEDKQIEVVAAVERPSLVEEAIKKHKPDVMTMDIHMPEMDGVNLLKKLQPVYKIPTIMISSISKEEGPFVLDALANGAIDYIQKPSANNLADVAIQIRERVKMAAGAVQVNTSGRVKKVNSKGPLDKNQLVLIGSSTGGTEALRVLFEAMPENIPPTVVVQHIPPVFSAAFAQRLNTLMKFEVKEAADGDEIKENRVLIAPGGMQLSISSLNGKLVVKTQDLPPMNRHKPSVDFMFKSALDLDPSRIIGVILTGMGNDGAKYLKELRDQGARTIAQSKETCVVFGMPREAIEIGAAEFIKPLDQIAETILNLSAQQKLKKVA